MLLLLLLVVAVVVVLFLHMLLLLFPMINVLYFHISTFRSVYAVLNVAVFCSSLMPCFLGMLSRCFLNDIEVILGFTSN